MTQIAKIPNKLPSGSVFWIFRIWDLFWPRFVSNFDIRILDLFRWLLGETKFPGVVLFKISKVTI